VSVLVVVAESTVLACKNRRAARGRPSGFFLFFFSAEKIFSGPASDGLTIDELSNREYKWFSRLHSAPSV